MPMTCTAWAGVQATHRHDADVATPSYAKYDRMMCSGRMSPLVELKLVDDAGVEVPWGSGESGRLLIRGPWITGSQIEESQTAL